MLAKLIADQEDLLALCDRLLAVLASVDPPAPGVLGALRWQSMRALGQHFGFLDSFVLPPLGAGADRIRRAIAQLQADHRDHLARFDALSESGHWQDYRASAARLVEATRRLVSLERTALNPLVAPSAPPPPLATGQR